MRSLKILAGAAGVALVALACSAGASADRLCKANEESCSKLWEAETKLEATIKSGTKFKLNAVEGTVGLVTCTGSTRIDQLGSNGGAYTTPITLKLLQESFSGCSSGAIPCTVTTLSLPSESVKWRASTKPLGNGYAEPASTASSITLTCVTLVCKWDYWEQTSHTYQGGSPAIEYLKARYVHGGGSHLCGKEAILEGEREIVSPNSNPIYWTLS
jgi:hypothetical protein